MEIYFLTVPEAESPRSRSQESWFPLRLLILVCRRLASPCVLTHPLLCVCVCVLIFSYKDTSQTGLGSTVMTSFSFNLFLTGAISKYRPILRCWGRERQHMALKGTQLKLWPPASQKAATFLSLKPNPAIISWPFSWPRGPSPSHNLSYLIHNLECLVWPLSLCICVFNTH